MRTVPGGRLFGAVALLHATLASAAPTVAVVSTDGCDRPSLIGHTESYQRLLEPRVGEQLQPRSASMDKLGGAARQPMSLAEVDRLLAGASADVAQGQSARALKSLTGVDEEIQKMPPSAARYGALVNVLSLVGHAQLKQPRTEASPEASADATFERLLRLDPNWAPNLDLYPPATRNFVAQLRTRLAKTSQRVALKVTTRPAGIPVFVNAKPIGPSPQTVQLPRGVYTVEADWGEGLRGLPREVTVQGPASVELDKSFEGSIFPDLLCARTDGTREGRITMVSRLAGLLGVQVVHAIHEEEPSTNERYLAAVTVSSYGEERLEGRVKLHSGGLSPSEWENFVRFMTSGEKPVPPVEAVRGEKTSTAAVTQVSEPTAIVSTMPLREKTETKRRGALLWVPVAGGVVAAAAGGAMLFVSFSRHQALTTRGTMRFSVTEADQLAQEESTFQTAGWVAAGIGGAAIVAGAVLYFALPDETVQLTFAASPSGAAAFLRGEFP